MQPCPYLDGGSREHNKKHIRLTIEYLLSFPPPHIRQQLLVDHSSVQRVSPMAVHVPFSIHHVVDIGISTGPVVIVLVLLFGLAVVGSDSLDGWWQKRALRGIPIVDEGSYMRPKLRWKRFDAEKEYARAYQQVSAALHVNSCCFAAHHNSPGLVHKSRETLCDPDAE